MGNENQKFDHDVFLSHSSKDKEVVRNIAQTLKSAGINVWLDEWKIKPGDNIYLKVEKALETSRVLILFLSNNAIQSDWVDLERSTVLFRNPTNTLRRFVPVLLSDCNLPDTLKMYKYIDYRHKLDSTLQEIIDVCKIDNEAQEIIWSSTRATKGELPEQIKQRIKSANKANRDGNYELATTIWNEIGEKALETSNETLSIRVKLELAYIETSEGFDDLDNPLKVANECLLESKRIDLGEHLIRILQLLGEIHRVKGNVDKARGFLNGALEQSRKENDLISEGWALIALAMLSIQCKEPFDIQFNYTKSAYDAFTKALVSGKENDSKSANAGYGFCHLVRAKIYGHSKHEQALSEYSGAISIYKELGEERNFDLGKLLLERGEMYVLQGDVSLGLQDIMSASNIFIELQNQYMAAKCFLACAELLDQQGYRQEAKKYYLSAVQTANPIKNEKKKSWFYFRYAMKLLELGEQDQAKEILLTLLSWKSLSKSQQLDVLKTLSDVAKVAQNKNDLKDYQEASLVIIDSLILDAQSAKERLRLLYNKGHALCDLEQYEDALEVYDRAINLAKSIPMRDRLPDILSSIAEIHHRMNNRKAERLAYEQVLSLCEEEGNSPQLVSTLTMIAQMEIKDSNFVEAARLLDKAEQLCKKVKGMSFMMFVITDIRKRLQEASSNSEK